jgi:beta-N-acetylhexosaminidase
MRRRRRRSARPGVVAGVAVLALCAAAAGVVVAAKVSAAGRAREAARTSGAARATGHRSTSAARRSQAGGGVTLPRMTGRQLAGQRVIYSYGGLTPPASLISLIRHGEAAGVIFFSANISSRIQIAGVIGELEKANASKLNPVRAPLLLMTDQEGGVVRRLPGPPDLSEKQVGLSARPGAQAQVAGADAAANLLGVGMNVNLAPVLDVYRVPGNFIDEFGRSYSSNPYTVSSLGADFITAQQGGGVAATVKHFPGLGAAAAKQNTDLGPVTLNLPKSTIRGVDELPYKAAISAGVKLVMASWAVYPSLASRPAGLSPTIITGELRTRLGYRGVTITDAIGAGALRAFGSTGHRSVLAAQAGMDLVLCAGQRAGEGVRALDALETAYRSGQLNQVAFKASVARILALRAGLRP